MRLSESVWNVGEFDEKFFKEANETCRMTMTDFTSTPVWRHKKQKTKTHLHCSRAPLFPRSQVAAAQSPSLSGVRGLVWNVFVWKILRGLFSWRVLWWDEELVLWSGVKAFSIPPHLPPKIPQALDVKISWTELSDAAPRWRGSCCYTQSDTKSAFLLWSLLIKGHLLKKKNKNNLQ